MSNFAALQASNGSGEAVRATVQSPGRSIGSTAIPVNAITNWPTGTFIGITGTLTASNTLTNAQVFYGTATGTTVTITSFAPGYSDLGNSAGDVVVIKPTTEWANLIADQLNTGLLKRIYPIGCIYTETTGSNPNLTFGFGTWAAFGAGRVLVGNGTSDQAFAAGSTGGESNHTLSVAEMPSHSHTDAGHTHGEQTAGGSGSATSITGTINLSTSPSAVPLSTQSGSASIQNTGGGGAHNNLQPYIVVYFWQRTA